MALFLHFFFKLMGDVAQWNKVGQEGRLKTINGIYVCSLMSFSSIKTIFRSLRSFNIEMSAVGVNNEPATAYFDHFIRLPAFKIISALYFPHDSGSWTLQLRICFKDGANANMQHTLSYCPILARFLTLIKRPFCRCSG